MYIVQLVWHAHHGNLSEVSVVHLRECMFFKIGEDRVGQSLENKSRLRLRYVCWDRLHYAYAGVTDRNYFPPIMTPQ